MTTTVGSGTGIKKFALSDCESESNHDGAIVAPGEGTYKYLLPGALVAGDVMLMATTSVQCLYVVVRIVSDYHTVVRRNFRETCCRFW